MFKKTSEDFELEKLIAKDKHSLENTFRNNFKIQEQTLSMIFEANRHASFNQFKGSRLIWNVAGFLNICSYDLKVVGKYLFFSTDEWQKRYFARQASLLIYELMNDLPELLGKDFREELSKLSDAETLKTELNQIRKKLNVFKVENKDHLSKIRNVSIAHRDKDIFEQFNIISSLEWHKFVKDMCSFDNILNELGKFLQKVMNKSSAELDRD